MRIRISLLVFVLASWPAAPVRATTLVRLSLEQLTEASSDIIRGHVVSQESRWNTTQTQIVTLTTVTLEQTVKGAPPATLVVEQPGGTVGNIHVRVAGTVQFRPQASYILFLEPSTAHPRRYSLVGMVQGAYRIYRDRRSKEDRVIPPLGRVFIAAEEAASTNVAPAEALPLRHFREQLAKVLETPIVIPPGTSIRLTIQSTESRGVARVAVLGRTAADIYPSAGVVIPAGSQIEGTAQLVSGTWRIHWTGISIRGTCVEISASNEEPAGGRLRGRMLVINVR